MNTADLTALDTHTHLEVSCRNPFDAYGEEYDRAADKYFRSSKRPTGRSATPDPERKREAPAQARLIAQPRWRSSGLTR